MKFIRVIATLLALLVFLATVSDMAKLFVLEGQSEGDWAAIYAIKMAMVGAFAYGVEYFTKREA